MTWENSGALGGTRTPSLLIRRLRQVVQDCPGVAGCWADIPGLSSCVRNWPWAWQRFWQQSQPLVSTLGVSGGGFCSSGSSRTISSHSARHSLHIRVVPADAMAATRSRAFPQKLHCPAPGSSPTCWILAIGVLAVRPGAASTVCTRRMQPSQIYALGPAISFLTCFWLFPQNEHERWFPASGTRSLYRGRPSAPRLLIRRLFRGSSRPGHVPSDVEGQRSPVRIVGLRFTALSGQNPASRAGHAPVGLDSAPVRGNAAAAVITIAPGALVPWPGLAAARHNDRRPQRLRRQHDGHI